MNVGYNIEYIIIFFIMIINIFLKDDLAIYIFTQEAYSYIIFKKDNLYIANGNISFKKGKILKYIQILKNNQYKRHIKIN